MPDYENRAPFIRPVIQSRVLEDAIARATTLPQEDDDANMGLSIIRPRPMTDIAPQPAVEDPTTEPEEPTGPNAELVRLIALMNQAIGLLSEIAQTPQAAPGTPIARAGRVSTLSATYAELVKWTVSSNRIGLLRELSMSSDNPATAEFQLLMGGEVQFSDLILDGGSGALSLPYDDNDLLGDVEIEIRVKSNGVATIVANGTIAGIERQPQ